MNMLKQVYMMFFIVIIIIINISFAYYYVWILYLVTSSLAPLAV